MTQWSDLLIPAAGVQDTADFVTVFFGDAQPDARDGEHFAVGAGSEINQPAQSPVGKDAEGGHTQPPGLGQPPRSERLFHNRIRRRVGRSYCFLFQTRRGSRTRC